MPAASRGGGEHAVVLVAEAAVVAGVRIQRAERDPRLGDAVPVAQAGARDARDLGDALAR